MTTPTPQLALTEHQQWAVVVALEVEELGFVAAANALRRKHFPHLAWDAAKRSARATTGQGWVDLFRAHHGSLPPMSAEAVHAAHPAQPFTPAPRADQITS